MKANGIRGKMSLQPILGDTVCDDMYLNVHVHRQSCVNLRM